MEAEERIMKDTKIMIATLIIVGVPACDFALFYTDMIVTDNPGLWLAIHAAEGLYIAWLMQNSVEVEKEN